MKFALKKLATNALILPLILIPLIYKLIHG